MCGKFTAMASWRKVWDFSQPLTNQPVDGSPEEIVTYRPMSALPVIVFDRETGERRVVPMRWGFPHRKNPRVPQPIHARSESIDETAAFRGAFLDGQRGIVVMRTFNEGEDIGSRTVQWTIDPGDGIPRGFAFLWRRFEIPDFPAPLLACVMVTVPASKLVAPVTDRMPAILEDKDWSVWLGETPASANAIKAVLKTVEGVNWKMEKEPRKAKPATSGGTLPFGRTA
ncbi:MAG TPA: SOS response-associated peptidase family protein [Rhizomicrobium sp.]|jgi:putative SOS response-associated peptidase YedK